MIRIFIILLASVVVPAFSSGLPPHQSAQLSEENNAWIRQAIDEADEILGSAPPSSLPSVSGARLSESDKAWLEKTISEAQTIARYTHQQMSHPGARPLQDFLALHENLRSGAQQGVDFMRSQGYPKQQGQ